MLAVESKITPEQPVAPTLIGTSSWKRIVEPVEPFLDAVTKRLAEQVNAFDPALSQYAEYAITGNGKHLRPTMVALAANSLGTVNDSHVTVAAIIEMIHLATLVHDDVMDEAEMRRGKLTLAANWGNEIAVLFGDCLFAQALKLASSFPTHEICRAVASATNTVCSGEILQTRHRKNFELSQKDYFRVLQMKTGELFALSCDMAALLGNATPGQRAALREFGMAFGTAYQIYDDCVDLFGTEKKAGKSLGTDLAKGKLTYPVLLAWERATLEDRAALDALVQNWQPGSLPTVNKYLARYETLGTTLSLIERHLEQARQYLRSLPESVGRAGLLGVTDFLAHQTAALSE
jgi:octaprenyl-diphosphate synthase